MTLLMPWVTLGSNINLCDALIAGGSGAELGAFSEVGSGSIHFNFTPSGDKATASLFGNVVEGVFLNQERLFIGGNNCLLGPMEADFGASTAAGIRIHGKLSKGLHTGGRSSHAGSLPGISESFPESGKPLLPSSIISVSFVLS